MVKCDICGKECKTAQGLAGHKQWAHGIAPDSAQLKLQPSSPLVTESKLEQRLTELERKLGFADIAKLSEYPEQPITELVSKLSKQLKDLQQQLEGSQAFAERIGERIADFTGELTDLERGVGQMFGEVYRMIDWHWHEGKQFIELPDQGEKEVPDVHLEPGLADKRHSRGYTKITYREKGSHHMPSNGHKPNAELDEIVRQLEQDKEG